MKTENIRRFLRENPPTEGQVGYYGEVARRFKTTAEYVRQVAKKLGVANVRTNKQASRTPKPKRTLQEEIVEDRRILALRSENEVLSRKVKALMKDANTQEKILEMARLTINALPTVPAPARIKPTKGQAVESAVLVGSCWHIGETINPHEMAGLNAYNFDIFCRRLQYLTQEAISFTTQNMRAHVFDELRVLLTGDMVSGVIHDELLETNELNIVEQATIGPLVTAQALLQLARVFPRIIVTCVVGNHGRVKHEKYFKHKQQVNWDYVFYNNLALLLKDQPNITFQIPLSWWAGTEIKGHNFLVMHGDLIKSWGGIPFYGINRMVAKWIEIEAAHKRFFRYFIASHFHNWAGIQTAAGENILNASMKGGDEYATGLALYSEPKQLLFGVHPKYGKTWELKINTRFGDSKPHSYQFNRSLALGVQTEAVK